jgi:hypothetical protein
MEALGFFFAAVYLPLLPAAVALLWFLASPSQRRKPGRGLVVLAWFAALAALGALGFLWFLIGPRAFDLFTILPVLASWALVAPVLARSFRGEGTGPA